MKKTPLIMFILMTLLSVSMFAGTTGKLTGRVTDAATGEALPFVNITLMGTTIGAATDMDGKFIILNIPPGKYNVKFQYVGYQSAIVENVQISIDLTTKQDITLSTSSVELEAVVVQGNVKSIKKDVTASEARVTADDISNMPVAEINDVIQMQAGVTKDAGGNFHIRGGRTTEIAYWVNGISITDGFDNSRGIEIDNSSIQELQVISGTFNAEYGQALSGIINTVTKEGGDQFHGNIKVYSSDYASNFTDYFTGVDEINPFENYNFQGSLSGTVPFTKKMLRFFTNLRYVYDDGYLYGYKKYTPTGEQGDGSLTAMNWSKRYLGQFNLSFTPSKYFKFRLEGLYSKSDFQDYDHAYKFNPDGNVNKFSESYNTTLTMTHTFSNTSFYTVKASYFKKDFKEHLYDDPFDSRYLHRDSLNNPIQYSFLTKGTNLKRFFRETETFLAKIEFTSQVTENHLLQFGVEGRIHQIGFDDYNLEPAKENGIEIAPFKPAIPEINTPNRTKYDEEPIEIAAYIQDKIEFDDVIINVGLRLDYFDSRGQFLVDLTDPNIYLPRRSELEDLSIEERKPFFYKDAEAKWQVSPRFGIAYPISEKGVIHFSYGHFLQVPTFQYLFQNGPFLVPETGNFHGPYGNPDLKPQKTVMYELGFRQELFDVFSIDVTGFYRDIRDWITASQPVVTKNLVTYSYYINKDYSNVKGLTLTLSKRYSDNYSIDINYTYQVAEGINSNPDDEFNASIGGAEPALFLSPLAWDQSHLLNATVYVGGTDWGSSLTARYGTGLPYTPSVRQGEIFGNFQTNSRRKPYQFTLDLQVHKDFKIYGLEFTAFMRVFNLLDNKVVVNVFGDSGKPDYTTEINNVSEDPNRPNTVQEFIKFPDHYGAPRKIQLGLEMNF